MMETLMQEVCEPLTSGEPTQSAAAQPLQARRSMRFIAMIATLGGLLFGYDTGVINGALAYMTQDLGLTPLTEGLVTSSLLLGAVIGSVASGLVADRYGRRMSIMILAVLFLGGALSCTFAPTVSMLIAARFVLGIAVGGASICVPTYLAELAPVHRRGQIITQNELMIVSGQMIAFIVNATMGSLWGSDHGIWRWMLAVATLPAVGLWFGMLVMPESPRWLASKGKLHAAWKVLQQVRDFQSAQQEFDSIRNAEHRHAHPALRTGPGLSAPWVRHVFWVGIGIAIVMQATGVNSIMFYGTQILTNSGFGRETALIGNVANGVISVVATLVGIQVLGKIGRRPMFLLGLSGTTLSLLMIGLFSQFLPVSFLRACLILVAMACFLGFMQALIAPVCWVLLAELFPLHIRGFAVGVAGCVLWMVNFVLGLSFPSLVAYVGISSTFFVFFVIGMVSIAFIWRNLPETRGRSLEEIEAHFRSLYGGAEQVR
ncbi:sugar porter family MFS transporter [Burkholderia diffusa]|uniref:sugar porter family MFS transporter n=1 Tax=Burkholderia diffusa TaxID=488732 RepID=UPI002AAF596F|nr:sugar porter family MFS transporter [Burkholderia diffusa]